MAYRQSITIFFSYKKITSLKNLINSFHRKNYRPLKCLFMPLPVWLSLQDDIFTVFTFHISPYRRKRERTREIERERARERETERREESSQEGTFFRHLLNWDDFCQKRECFFYSGAAQLIGFNEKICFIIVRERERGNRGESGALIHTRSKSLHLFSSLSLLELVTMNNLSSFPSRRAESSRYWKRDA